MSELFTVLWIQTQPAIAAYLGSATAGSSDAEDLLQECAIIAHRQFDEFDQSRSFTAWCIGIAYNVLRNHKRKRSHQAQVLDNDVLELLSSSAEEESQLLRRYAIRLEHCLKRLNERAQRLIQRFYHDEITQEQLALEEGMSHNSVRTAISRTRTQLRQCIEGKADE